MKLIFIFLSSIFYFTLRAGDAPNKENEILALIESEFLKASINYNHKDSLLFNDFEEVLVSLAITDQFATDTKLDYYDYLYLLIKDINNNLYATKKIEDHDYRRAIRMMPSIFYYKQQGLLVEYLKQNHQDAIRALPYIFKDPDAKKFLVEYATEKPKLFYGQVEDFAQLGDLQQLLNLVISYDPVSWVKMLDKHQFLSDLAASSNSQLVKKVLEIKSRMGVNSELYYLLDDIIKNSFNDSHEWEFKQNQFILTKKLLAACLDPNAYARNSAMQFLSKKGEWVLDDFFDNGPGGLSQYSTKEIMTLLVLTHESSNPSEIIAILQYLAKYDDDLTSVETLQILPADIIKSFVQKIYKANLENELKKSLTESAYNYCLDLANNSQAKLSPKNEDWFMRKYTYETEIRQKKQELSKAITTTFHLNKTQLSLLSWARNINKVDSNLNSILKSPIGSRFIDYLAAYHPHIILKNKESLKTQPEFPNIINKLAYFSPNSIKKYLGNPDHLLTKQIMASNEPIPKTLIQIFNQHQFNTKSYSLIHKILNRELTIDEAHRIGQSDVQYLKALMHITVQKNPIGLHSVEEEQNQLSLKFIRSINDNPSQSHPNLKEIKQFNAKEIYSLMVLGKEEIFQFAFDNCYYVLLQNLGETSLIDFLPKVNHYKFREFSSLLATFHKFPELFYRNSTPESRQEFLEKLTKIDFSDINCIEEASVLCEFINNCDHTEIQSSIQNIIKSEYDLAEIKKDQLAMAVYSLLASNIGQRALVHQDWFKNKKENFAKYSLNYIDVAELKSKHNKIIEVNFFYNDGDGIASFNNYIQLFRLMPKWYIQDLGSYYYISSLEGNDYDIFANKPQHEVSGQQAIRDYLVYNKLEPSIIVHRGHSYHSQKTIDQMVGSPKFIFMGSCGGYYKISELLVRSPDAQILSTKQVGTMNINDPMLKSIREILRNNKNLDWPSFWADQEIKLRGNKDFKMYIPPHKNNGALFVNAFFKVVGL
ncbi:MAG: hypothetical protein ACK5UE_06480 [Chitinophagales bacterium]|nr:hypothetical protein [Sphingobacteriales bacterium]